MVNRIAPSECGYSKNGNARRVLTNLIYHLSSFAGFGAMGNVSGLVLCVDAKFLHSLKHLTSEVYRGGVISQLLTWRWIFWIIAMVVLPLAFLALLLAPSSPPEARGHAKLGNMDWIGLCTITCMFVYPHFVTRSNMCFLLIVSLILFIYSITEGNTRGWSTGGILAPLIIAILLLPVFGFIETKVHEPLVPPGVWTLPEFVPLFFLTMRLVNLFLLSPFWRRLFPLVPIVNGVSPLTQ